MGDKVSIEGYANCSSRCGEHGNHDKRGDDYAVHFTHPAGTTTIQCMPLGVAASAVTAQLSFAQLSPKQLVLKSIKATKHWGMRMSAI